MKLLPKATYHHGTCDQYTAKATCLPSPATRLIQVCAVLEHKAWVDLERKLGEIAISTGRDACQRLQPLRGNLGRLFHYRGLHRQSSRT